MRVLWITGASSGIGLATARLASDAGWQLALSSRQEQDPVQIPDATWVPCDVTSWAQQALAVERILGKFGRLDAVFANAGFGCDNSLLGGDHPQVWDDMVRTNIVGVAYTMRAALPSLIKTRGHMLVTGSAMGRRHVKGSLYAATKHAVHELAENARLELDGSGVRVTTIAPGMVNTKFHKTFPIRPLEPEDVAEAVLWALEQPSHMDVNEILVRPVEQQQ